MFQTPNMKFHFCWADSICFKRISEFNTNCFDHDFQAPIIPNRRQFSNTFTLVGFIRLSAFPRFPSATLVANNLAETDRGSGGQCARSSMKSRGFNFFPRPRSSSISPFPNERFFRILHPLLSPGRPWHDTHARPTTKLRIAARDLSLHASFTMLYFLHFRLLRSHPLCFDYSLLFSLGHAGFQIFIFATHEVCVILCGDIFLTLEVLDFTFKGWRSRENWFLNLRWSLF